MWRLNRALSESLTYLIRFVTVEKTTTSITVCLSVGMDARRTFHLILFWIFVDQKLGISGRILAASNQCWKWYACLPVDPAEIECTTAVTTAYPEEPSTSNYRYKKVTTKQKWTEAETNCQSDGGQLAVLDIEEDFNWARTVAGCCPSPLPIKQCQ